MDGCIWTARGQHTPRSGRPRQRRPAAGRRAARLQQREAAAGDAQPAHLPSRSPLSVACLAPPLLQPQLLQPQLQHPQLQQPQLQHPPRANAAADPAAPARPARPPVRRSEVNAENCIECLGAPPPRISVVRHARRRPEPAQTKLARRKRSPQGLLTARVSDRRSPDCES